MQTGRQISKPSRHSHFTTRLSIRHAQSRRGFIQRSRNSHFTTCLTIRRARTRTISTDRGVPPAKPGFAFQHTFEHPRAHPAQPEFAFHQTFEHSTRAISAKGHASQALSGQEEISKRDISHTTQARTNICIVNW